ncbi:NAD-dependent epimerase/dehydratase family protein [Flavobacterium sp. XGLA_31]|uniref:NAD-dependent epimerase/dehydratase family protein n=1 Tax=Flavobacterium sp. XGLA_31 TaxID=3447666 RepID=UPI003F2F8424
MILVTGGTGLVGAHLLLHLTENEQQIRATYRQTNSIQKTKDLFILYQKHNQFDCIEWVQADINDIPALEKAFEGIQFVYHCAGLISYDPADEEKLRKTNIEGTANIVNLCLAKSVSRLCHVSSIAALGDLAPQEKEITETTEWNPEAYHSDYAISKYGAEMEVWRGQQEGLNVIVVNPGIIFGPGFWEQGSGAFFTSVKERLPFYTNGTTGFVGITDVVRIMIRLMENNKVGERYTLVAENLTFKEVIFEIAENLNVRKPQREAKPWMLSLAWRLDWFLATFLNRKRKLSKYSANALTSSETISNQKIATTFNFEFQSIRSVIKEVISLQSN